MSAGNAVRVYNAIMQWYADKGQMPTYREIGRQLALAVSVVHAAIKTLQAWGWIEREKGIRSMRLTRPTERGVSPSALKERIEALHQQRRTDIEWVDRNFPPKGE